MKRFLAVAGYLLVTLFAAVGAIWLAKEPIAVMVCAAAKRNISPDECIKSVAVFLSRPDMCQRVTGAEYTTNINGNMVQFENPPKAQCISDIAVATNDVALCSKLEEAGFVSATPVTCLASVAQKWGNAAACDQMTGSESR